LSRFTQVKKQNALAGISCVDAEDPAQQRRTQLDYLRDVVRDVVDSDSSNSSAAPTRSEPRAGLDQPVPARPRPPATPTPREPRGRQPAATSSTEQSFRFWFAENRKMALNSAHRPRALRAPPIRLRPAKALRWNFSHESEPHAMTLNVPTKTWRKTCIAENTAGDRSRLDVYPVSTRSNSVL
jgi:hypothetical protein